MFVLYTFEAKEKGAQPLDKNSLKKKKKKNLGQVQCMTDSNIYCSNRVPPLSGSYWEVKPKGGDCLPKKMNTKPSKKTWIERSSNLQNNLIRVYIEFTW